MSSNITFTPVSSSGASAGNAVPATTTTTTILSSAQASQLLQRLRAAGAGGEGGTIKIQTVQTNPQTGVRQIIAIPIQTTSAASSSVSMAASVSSMMHHGKISVSPLKARLPQSFAASSPPPVLSGTTASLGPNVKVVKLSSASLAAATAAANAAAVAAASAEAAANGGRAKMTTTTLQIANSAQVLTPSKQQGNLNFMSPMLDSVSRKRSDIDFDAFSDAKRRKSEKGGKGLRHFSMKVCEKVQAKGSTSYNEVADELVSELTDPRCTSPTDQQYDQKNIRRRVYDALNVLMAMNIISKEKKEIRWLGLPTNSVQEANSLEIDKAKRMERIKAKTQQLQDLILQQIAFKNLVERNKEREKVEGAPAPNSAIQLPFIIVNTSKKTVIDCSISNDKMEYLFNFDDTFEIHDDMEVLKRMGLGFGLEHGHVTPEDLNKARQMVPRALEQYVIQLAENGPGNCAGMPKVSDPIILKHGDVEDRIAEELDSDSDVDIS